MRRLPATVTVLLVCAFSLGAGAPGTYEDLLLAVLKAWRGGDLVALRGLCTPRGQAELDGRVKAAGEEAFRQALRARGKRIVGAEIVELAVLPDGTLRLRYVFSVRGGMKSGGAWLAVRDGDRCLVHAWDP